MAPSPDIIVIADGDADIVSPDMETLLGFAGRMRALTGGGVKVWVVGAEVQRPAERIAAASGYAVTAISSPGLSPYLCEAYVGVLAPLISRSAPALFCTIHNSRGWEWAPVAAARTGAACICGVDGVDSVDGRIGFARDCHGGKVKGQFVADAAATIVTVKSGSFAFKPEDGMVSPGTVSRETASVTVDDSRYDGVARAVSGPSDFSGADVVVAAGNGIGDVENLEWIHRLAQLFPRSAVAGTRIVCDRGWLGYDRQVGVTGATISPALYIACGISGAYQHLVGMQGAGFVVAINTDAGAPMLAAADLCIVEDAVRFIPLVLEKYQAMIKTESSP